MQGISKSSVSLRQATSLRVHEDRESSADPNSICNLTYYFFAYQNIGTKLYKGSHRKHEWVKKLVDTHITCRRHATWNKRWAGPSSRAICMLSPPWDSSRLQRSSQEQQERAVREKTNKSGVSLHQLTPGAVGKNSSPESEASPNKEVPALERPWGDREERPMWESWCSLGTSTGMAELG